MSIKGVPEELRFSSGVTGAGAGNPEYLLWELPAPFSRDGMLSYPESSGVFCYSHRLPLRPPFCRPLHLLFRQPFRQPLGFRSWQTAGRVISGIAS